MSTTTSTTTFTRRTLVSGAAGLTAALGLGSLTVTGAAAAPACSMTALVLAAQCDPPKADTAPTDGSQEAVTLVEEALADLDLLESDYVDDHYGTSTLAAYARFQESLGFTGIDANGVPGLASLRELAKDRFEITDPIDLGGRVTHGGQEFNARTRDMLVAAEKRAGVGLTISKGSFKPGDSNSSFTHSGGGAVDLVADDYEAAVRALREVGFAAWVRTPDQGFEYHIHGIAVGDNSAHREAADQVASYYRGGNGLASEAPDDGPEVDKVLWEQYLAAGGER